MAGDGNANVNVDCGERFYKMVFPLARPAPSSTPFSSETNELERTRERESFPSMCGGRKAVSRFSRFLSILPLRRWKISFSLSPSSLSCAEKGEGKENRIWKVQGLCRRISDVLVLHQSKIIESVLCTFDGSQSPRKPHLHGKL